MLFTVLLVFLAGTPATVLGQPCSTLNPYIGSLPPAVLYSTPQAVTQTEVRTLKCGYAWKKGTCCDEAKLKDVARLRNQAIDTGLYDLGRNLKCIEDKIDIFKKSSDSNRKISELNVLGFLLRLSKREVREGFIRKAAQCWNYMKQMRGAALCNMCGVGSNDFFESGKAKVAKDTCDLMLTKCEDFFHEMLQLAGGMTTLHDIVRKMPNFKPSSHVGQLVSSLDSIAQETRGNQVLTDMVTFHNMKTQGKNAQVEIVKTICNGLFVLNDKSFVEKINPLMTLTCRKTDEIMDGVKAYAIWKGSQKNRILFGKSRELQLGESSALVEFPYAPNWAVVPFALVGDVVANDHPVSRMNMSLILP